MEEKVSDAIRIETRSDVPISVAAIQESDTIILSFCVKRTEKK